MPFAIDAPFGVVIYVDRKPIRLSCTCLHKGMWSEQWEVKARNKTLVFETNRPVIEKHGLKHRRWDWTLLRGDLSNIKVRNDITLAMECHLKGKEPPGKTTTPFNRDRLA